MSLHTYDFCRSKEPCVFRDKEKHTCRILEDAMNDGCSFRKTKKQYVKELKEYPPLNKDIEYVCKKMIETGED